MRDVASGKNCVSTEQGTLCSYTTAEVEAYNAANPGVSDTLAAGCVKHIKGTTCLYPIDVCISPSIELIARLLICCSTERRWTLFTR